MFQDVEIIEYDDQIIEISDDEDCKVVYEIDDDVQEILYEEQVSQYRTSNAERDISILSKGNAAEVVENICENEIKQECNSDTNSKTVTSGHNSVSHVIKSENNRTNKKRRRRNRGSRIRKNNLGALSEKIGSNRLDNNNQNSNINSANVVQSTWSSSNAKDSDFDFSKLKWLKPLNNLSSPPHLQMVIIDRSHTYWRIEKEKWLMVEKRLLEALNTEMIRSNDSRIGLFDGAKWQRGIKIVGCHNENAFDFIMKFFRNLDKLWKGAKLDAFPISYINRHVVKAYIPPPTIKTELILSLLKLQNPSVHSNDWRVVRERERTCNSGLDIWLSINDQSYIQLSSLRGELKFGINRIFLNPSS